MTANITNIITAIGTLHAEAQRIVAALDVQMQNEPDHGRRGSLARLRTSLVDLHHGIGAGLSKFQASTLNAAGHALHGAAADLRTILTVDSDATHRAVLDRSLDRIKTTRATLAR